MSTLLYESVARIARHEARARGVAAVGRVVDIFPAGDSGVDHAVNVELRDSKLLLPRVPIAVGALGFAAIPAVGSLVVVAFLEGEYDSPVVIGRLYHPDEDPPAHAAGEMVLRLPSGSAEPKLQAVVRGDEPSLAVDLTGDVHVELREENVLVRVGQGDDAMSLSLTGQGGGRAELTAGGARLIIRKDGDIELSTTGNLRLQGANVEISGSQSVRVTGAEVQVN